MDTFISYKVFITWNTKYFKKKKPFDQLWTLLARTTTREHVVIVTERWEIAETASNGRPLLPKFPVPVLRIAYHHTLQ